MDQHGLAHRVLVIEQVLRRTCAQDDHLLAGLDVHLAEIPPLLDLKIVAQRELGTAQLDGGRAALHIFRGLVPVDDGALGGGVGRHSVNQGAEAQTVVVEGLGDIPAAPLFGGNGDAVVSQALIVLLKMPVGALDHRDHDNYGRHADDDAQHGEQGAHLIGADGLECHPERLTQIHSAISSRGQSTTICPSAMRMIRRAAAATLLSWVMSRTVVPCSR